MAGIHGLLWLDRNYRILTLPIYILLAALALLWAKKREKSGVKNLILTAGGIIALSFFTIWTGNFIIMFRCDTLLQTMFFAGWSLVILKDGLEPQKILMKGIKTAVFFLTGFAAIFAAGLLFRQSTKVLSRDVIPIVSDYICINKHSAEGDYCFRAVTHPYDMAVSNDGEHLFVSVQSQKESLFKIRLGVNYQVMPFESPYVASLDLRNDFKGDFIELNATRIALRREAEELWYPFVEGRQLPGMTRENPGALLVIDTKTLGIKNIIPTTKTINSIRLSPRSDLAFIVSQDQRDFPGRIEIFDAIAKRQKMSIPYKEEIGGGGFSGYSIDFDQDLNRIFATSYTNGKLIVLSYPEGKLIKKMKISRSLQRIEVDQSRHLVYIADPVKACIHIMDGRELKLIDRIPVSIGVREIRFDPEGRFLFCGSFTTGSLDILQVDSKKLVASYSIMRGIRGVYFDRPEKRVFVSAPGLIAQVNVGYLYPRSAP